MMQYLEDCGILSKILSGELCAHYRPFLGHIFYPWCRPLEQLDTKGEICSICHLRESPAQVRDRLILVGNFLSG